MKYLKLYIPALFLLLNADNLMAQAAASAAPEKASNASLPEIMTLVLVVMVGLVLVVALWSLVRVNNAMYNNIQKLYAEARGESITDTVEDWSSREDGFWTKFRKKYWEDAVPIEKETEILMDHGYDGIKELDNSLPPWWINMFYLTIIWAVGYMFYYHWSSNNWSSEEEYKQEMLKAKKEIALALAGRAESIDESNVTRLTETAAINDGELIFKTSCAACHGQKGEGLVGPNFTDPNWLHGGGIKNIFKTIKNGVPDKGMISWAAQLKPSDMQKVASYIMTLEGTNPPNPKAPQGEVWKDEATPDSTTVAPAKTGK